MFHKLFVFGYALAVALAIGAASCFAQTLDLPPDFLSTLAAGGGVSALTILAIVHLAASVFCSVTATPHPGTRWGRVYQLVELLAIITRNSKLTGIASVDEINAVRLASATPSAAKSVVDAVAKAILAMLAIGFLGIGLIACTEAQLQQANANVKAVSQEALVAAQTACTAYMPMAGALALTNDETVIAHLKYGNSVCAPVLGLATATPVTTTPPAPVAIDEGTAEWVNAITVALKVAATAPVPAPAAAAPVPVAASPATPVATTAP